MIKVSVIIPVYNTERYLKETINSVIRQTLKETEIICVNDGSTDHSLDILKSLKENDDRIVIINQTNQGQSAARNRGLELAVGEYIYFLDSDDLITHNAFSKLYHIAKKDDLDDIFFDAETLYESGFEKMKFASSRHWNGEYCDIYNGLELMGMFQDKGDWICSVPRQFFKRTFLHANSLKFYEGITHEDELFTAKILQKANRVRCLNEKLFIRRVRANSCMTNPYSTNDFIGYFTVWFELLRQFMNDEVNVRENCIKKQIELSTQILMEHYAKLKKIGRTSDVAFEDCQRQMLFQVFKIVERGKREYFQNIGEATLKVWRSYSRVYIYGAGMMARQLVQKLDCYQLEIRGIVVSNQADNPKTLMGHRVYGIDDIVTQKDECLIVIGVTLKYEAEIRSMLKERGFANIIMPEC